MKFTLSDINSVVNSRNLKRQMRGLIIISLITLPLALALTAFTGGRGIIVSFLIIVVYAVYIYIQINRNSRSNRAEAQLLYDGLPPDMKD